jgi:hypothetical protein
MNNKELKLEAQSYLDRNYSLSYERTTWQKLHEKTFIAGATSEYVEKQKLEFAIEQLEYVKKMYPDKDSEECVNVRLKELKQKLNEYETN